MTRNGNTCHRYVGKTFTPQAKTLKNPQLIKVSGNIFVGYLRWLLTMRHVIWIWKAEGAEADDYAHIERCFDTKCNDLVIITFQIQINNCASVATGTFRISIVGFHQCPYPCVRTKSQSNWNLMSRTDVMQMHFYFVYINAERIGITHSERDGV